MARYTLTFLLIISLMGVAKAQSWDYEAYPDRNLEFLHLDGDLRVTEMGLIEGDLLYTATVTASTPDSLVLHASRINIITTEVNNTVADYRIEDNLLIIYPAIQLNRGDNVQVRVQYSTDPQFGVHRSEYGSILTSHLPLSTQHWMPVFDHPRTTFTFDLAFTHPSDFQVVSTGRRGSTDLLSVDEATTLFSSNYPVPATSLTWISGDFRQSVSTIRSTDNESDLNLPPGFERRANPQIYIYSENEDAYLNRYLVQSADNFLAVSEYFGVQFPYRDLHIVFLDEDFLEEKNYGAGVIYVFRNKGEIENQIKRGIVAQWAGVMFREEQWQDSNAILLLQAIAFSDLFDFDPDLITRQLESFHPYDTFSDIRFYLWLSNVKSGSLSELVSDVKWVQRNFNRLESGIINWIDLARIIYESTGQNYMEVPELDSIDTADDVIYEYLARIQWIENENRIELYFEALSEPVSELVTVEVEEVTFTDNRLHEVTFSGENDGVVLNVSSALEYVKLTVKEREDVQLIVEKPYLFWISQLREDESISRRVEAAKGLAGNRDNPDLQLALNDLLQVETHPEVFAEILKSMAQITAGASGTDERFIRYSSDQQHLLVQKAATEALANYPGNDRVISRLRNIILQTTDSGLRRSAIRTLAEVTNTEQFASQVQNLITRDVLLNHVPFMLQMMAEKGEIESAIELSETFIAAGFPQKIRLEVLDLMNRYDNSSGSWNNRLPMLLSDKNPAIRLAAAKSLQKLTQQQRRALISEFIDDEFDARVLYLLN